MPSPSRGLTQPERVELSTRKLVAAAAELIVEKGWEATTAAEIGRRAGYSRAMVHARFGAKDVLLIALLDEYAQGTWDTQRLKEEYLSGYARAGAEMVAKGAIMGALSLYLNFINLFMFLLQFFGNRD